nr:MAG TPA: hypothetical protein [Caudoviricetes sp.]
MIYNPNNFLIGIIRNIDFSSIYFLDLSKLLKYRNSSFIQNSCR